MVDFMVCAYYTIDTPYKQEAEELEKTLKQFNILYYIKPYPNRGSWVANITISPSFIQHCLELFPGVDILYLDVDARVMKPIHFEKMADIGVHYLHDIELISSTMFFRNNEKVGKLVQEWIDHQVKNPQKWDQTTLQEVLEVDKSGIEVTPLDEEYVWIEGITSRRIFPVIKQTQASRKYKSMVQTVPTGVRVLADGTFMIPRGDRDLEKVLDQEHTRVLGELKWYPRIQKGRHWEELSHFFKDKEVIIVGKGPSLDKIKSTDLDGTVIGINHAAEAIQDKLPDGSQLFMMQQDRNLKAQCRILKGIHIISFSVCDYYLDGFIYIPEELGFKSTTATVLCALELVKRCGAKGAKLLCFDACLDGNIEYAECIEKGPISPNAFLRYCEQIKRLYGDFARIIPLGT